MWFFILVFFFKQKTAYEMRISDWSSDVCSSDLVTAKTIAAVVEEAAECIGIGDAPVAALRGAQFAQELFSRSKHVGIDVRHDGVHLVAIIIDWSRGEAEDDNAAGTPRAATQHCPDGLLSPSAPPLRPRPQPTRKDTG